MHLIKDEHGNPVHHGHEHTHEHTHGETQEQDKTLVLIQYMLDHNTHHADELAEMADSLAYDKEIANAIMDAVADFRRGNEKLARVISLAKERR